MKAGTVCGANFSQKSGCIQCQCGLVGNVRSALHIQIGYAMQMHSDDVFLIVFFAIIFHLSYIVTFNHALTLFNMLN